MLIKTITKTVILKSRGSLTETINSFLYLLLEKNALKWLLAPVKDESGLVHPELLSREDDISRINTIAPLIPGENMGTTVSLLTRESPLKEKLGVILRPCESKALVELAKYRQISTENLYVIGVECYGTYHVLKYREMLEEGSNPSEEMLKFFLDRGGDGGFRSSCLVCLTPKPPYSDVNICYLTSWSAGEVVLEIKTDRGLELVKKLGYEAKRKATEGLLREILEERRKEREKFFADAKKELNGVDKLNEFFEECIGCHNCMEVCPICFCKECFFDSERYPYVTRKYLKWRLPEGTVLLPNSKLQFHIGRTIHMGFSCIHCGLCEQACPKEIPLYKFFGLTAERVQKLFNYHPGENLDEKPPIQEFREEEFQEVVG